jgi:hypothetical protein
MTPEVRTAKRAEMARRWLAGETGPAIAEALEIQLKTVAEWRRAMDLPLHGAVRPPANRTEEILPRLRELRAKGLSIKDCAAAVGISKNSASGICHRHQIPSPPGPTLLERANAVLAARKAARQPKAAAPLVKHPTGPVKPVARWTPAEELLPRAAIVPVQGCQFPIGTPGRQGFRFCGEAREGTGPYCTGCRRICWQRVPAWERAA